MQLLEKTVTGLLDQIRARTISVADVAEATITRMEQTNHINAFISTNPEVILANARLLDKEIEKGEFRPLHGLPIIVKDNIDTADFRTTGGTPALENHQPVTNAKVIEQLIKAGALIMGKANMHELAFGITSNNQHYGPVHNPYNHELIAGGSSGGTSAAISAGIIPAGLGTDTGGSARIPAALCGICGFRPTTGRYSNHGLILLSKTRDTVGIFAHTSKDISLIDNIISAGNNLNNIDLKKLRIGIPRDPFYKALDKNLTEVIETTLERLSSHGTELIECDMKNLSEINDKVSFPVVLYETLIEINGYLQTHNVSLSIDELFKKVKSQDVKQTLDPLLNSGAVPKNVYEDAINIFRPQLQQLYAGYFKDNKFDVMLYPTTPVPAHRIGQDEFIELNGHQVPTFTTYIRNCDPSANAGVPSLSIPVGLTNTGLPVGLSIDGPAGSDEKVLSIGSAIETIIPPISAPEL